MIKLEKASLPKSIKDLTLPPKKLQLSRPSIPNLSKLKYKNNFSIIRSKP
jgi:hypothetical protein